MQKKIESFFKHSSSPSSSKTHDIFEGIRDDKHPLIKVTYSREGNEAVIEKQQSVKLLKIENKKRNYAQFHLDLGQSDFLLHTCKSCGFNFAKGDQIDDKLHSTFHNNFTLGIPFKGWRHENVIDLPLFGKGRIILVSSFDSSVQKRKIEEVVKMMEIELGDGWIFNELCKCLQVYLFISSQRVAGCVFAESISIAHKILSGTVQNIAEGVTGKEVIPKSKTLQFGGICFQREVSRKRSSHRSMEIADSSLLGSIVCEEEARPASCGIRAIWVSPSNRRKHIATHLLDAVRKNFSTGYVLERSQLAFSIPTSAGKALATKYTGVGSFLVYKTS